MLQTTTIWQTQWNYIESLNNRKKDLHTVNLPLFIIFLSKGRLTVCISFFFYFWWYPLILHLAKTFLDVRTWPFYYIESLHSTRYLKKLLKKCRMWQLEMFEFLKHFNIVWMYAFGISNIQFVQFMLLWESSPWPWCCEYILYCLTYRNVFIFMKYILFLLQF